MQPTENPPQILLIAQTLRDIYAGTPWHGPSVKDILRDITPQQASSRPLADAHSIWELVLHMTVWRQFAWNRLTDNHAFEVSAPEQDWPEVTNDSQPAWEAALTGLAISQQQLLEALADFPEENLHEPVPGKDYSWHNMLLGLIGHDLYHAGQIALLKKAL
jgi:uncharacterized damage-inducible protein DinB